MEDCTKLANLPSTYYADLPFTKYKATQIIKATGAKKKQFSTDIEFKKFLKNEYAKSFIPLIIDECRDNKDFKKNLITQLLQLSD